MRARGGWVDQVLGGAILFIVLGAIAWKASVVAVDLDSRLARAEEQAPAEVASLMSAVVLVTGPGEAADHGTGFAVTPHLVVTAAHVARALPKIQLVTFAGTEHRATVVAEAPDDDLAALFVTPTLSAVVPVRCGRPSVGTPVRALGHPLTARWTVHSGYVASDRPFGIGPPAAIPVDLGVSSGQSGAPLVDRQGFVVGVVFGALVDRVPGPFGPFPMSTNTAGAVPGDRVCALLEGLR